MDIKKDTQGRPTLASVSNDSIELFSLSVGKKSERLATAVYLVTSFLSDTEPVKSRLRVLSLDLVKDTTVVRYGSPVAEKNIFQNLISNINETLALLELAFISGLISEMNFIILKREYDLVRGKIEIKKLSKESRSDSVLGDNFFGENYSVKLYNGHSKGHAHSEVSDSNKYDKISPTISRENAQINLPIKDISKTAPQTKNSVAKNAEKVFAKPTDTVEKQARRTRIIKLIKDNREVSIKDITAHFPELSEKTIQRELVLLTDEGVLKKYGERRWSRYALA